MTQRIYRKSILSGKVTFMDLPVLDSQFDEWNKGKLAQDAFPNLSDGEREFLMSGITEAEWEAEFGKEE